jgi:hypothetical protein
MDLLDPRNDDYDLDRKEYERAMCQDRPDLFDVDPESTTANTHVMRLSNPGDAWRRRDGIASVRRADPAP